MAKCARELASVGVRLRLMFQDEGRFGRISTPRRCWAPRGIRPDVPSQIVREYTYGYVAVSPHDGAMDSLILPQVMVMDGAGWHKANALMVPDNMALFFLPPYSPQLNPVEHIWESIRENGFRNEVFNSLEGVENQLMQCLAALERDPASVASMTGFPWIISINLNAT